MAKRYYSESLRKRLWSLYNQTEVERLKNKAPDNAGELNELSDEICYLLLQLENHGGLLSRDWIRAVQVACYIV